jgi:hypothetical protein
LTTELDATTPSIQLPPLHAAASSASRDGQTRFVRATGAQVVLVVGAAFFGIVSWTYQGIHVAAILSAIAFGLAILFRLYLTAVRPERQWYDGRAVSESVKTLAWRYAVGGEPFSISATGSVELFSQRIRDVLGLFADLTFGASDVSPQVTETMELLRARDIATRRRAYELHRIVDQQSWYGTKATYNRTRATRWAYVVLAAEGLGLTCAILRAADLIEVDLLGLIAAFSIAAAAWLQVKQHDSLARAYSVASQELGNIRSEVQFQTTETGWARWVDEAEEAISREHTPWRASRGVKGDLTRLTRPVALPRDGEQEVPEKH